MAEKLDNKFFDELIKDTEFVIAKTGSLMNSRRKVVTPLLVVNCIYGGGIPLGVIGEISGPPSSGKSTFSYQCMANFQRDFEDGVPVVYDMESSMDEVRLSNLGVDSAKVLRLPATTMEQAFSSLFKMCTKIENIQDAQGVRVPTFQIYDTISTGGTNKQHEAAEKGNSVMNAGGMQEAPRILKQNISNIFPFLERLDLSLLLLNQVFTQMGTFTSTVGSGGGYGLKHGAHYHISFGNSKDCYENGFLVGTESMVKLEKSKLSPKFIDIPCYIDATTGGRIDEVDSFIRYVTAKDIIKAGSWYSMKDTLDSLIQTYPCLDTDEVNSFKKNMRKRDLYDIFHENHDLLNLMQIALIDYINAIYPLQRNVNEGYQRELMQQCKYFDNADIPNEEGIE